MPESPEPRRRRRRRRGGKPGTGTPPADPRAAATPGAPSATPGGSPDAASAGSAASIAVKSRSGPRGHAPHGRTDRGRPPQRRDHQDRRDRPAPGAGDDRAGQGAPVVTEAVGLLEIGRNGGGHVRELALARRDDLVIPAAVIRSLGLRPGDMVDAALRRGGVEIRQVNGRPQKGSPPGRRSTGSPPSTPTPRSCWGRRPTPSPGASST